MRIKIDYEASKQLDGMVTEEKVPGVIFTEIPEDKLEDENYIQKRLREETEDPEAKLIGFERQ